LLPQRDLKRGFRLRAQIDRPAKSPSGKSGVEKKRPRGQRVLDGLSGVRVGRLKKESGVSDTVSFEIRTSNAAMIP
jgi:hypothetical protein